jgi:hypothetical protein
MTADSAMLDVPAIGRNSEPVAYFPLRHSVPNLDARVFLPLDERDRQTNEILEHSKSRWVCFDSIAWAVVWTEDGRVHDRRFERREAEGDKGAVR